MIKDARMGGPSVGCGKKGNHSNARIQTTRLNQIILLTTLARRVFSSSPSKTGGATR
jgi:hypothetical protein